MRERVVRAGGHYAFSQRVLLPILVLLSYGTVFADNHRPYGGTTSEWVTIAAIAGACAWAWFTAWGVVAQRLLPDRPLIRGRVAAALYVTTDAFRAVLVGALTVQFGIADHIDWGFRLVAGGMTGLVFFSLLAIVLNDAWAYREQRIELGRVRSSLRQAVAIRRVDLDARFAELAESVRDAVRVALRAIGQEHPNAPESARVAAIELTRISDEVVRPLSHRMYREILLEQDDAEVERVRVTLGSVLERASVVAPFRPEATVLVSGLLMLGQVLFGGGGVSGLIGAVMLLAAVYAVLWAGRRWMTPRLPALPPALRWLTILGYTGAFFVLAGDVISVAILGISRSDSLLQILYTLILGWVLVGIMALGPGVRVARMEAIAELTAYNRNLQWQRARLNAQLLSEQKAVARALHRDVQGVLVAASLRLEEAVRRGESLDDASNEVRELIELATNFAVARQPVPLTAALIDELRDRWLNVLSITADLPSEVAAAFDTDPIARRSFADVLGEFCVDSVKHGRARSVQIRAEFLGSDSVSVILVNDGDPLSEGAPTGLGSDVFASSLMRFERHNIAGGVQAEAELPIDRG